MRLLGRGVTVEEVKDEAKEVKEEVSDAAWEAVSNPWVERLARFGYAVRGLLYIVVGILAVQVAIGAREQLEDKGGAIGAIAAQTQGKLLLVLMLIGLAGYSLWGFIRAFMDPLERGTDPKGLAERAGYVVSGLTYGALIFPTVRLLLGSGNPESGSDDPEILTTSWLLAQPFGPWLVAIIGAIGAIGGLGQLYLAYTASFKKDFKSWQMSPEQMQFATRVGRIGHAARGIVFALIGFFLVRAGLLHNPNEAKGLDEALLTLAQQRIGPWLLGLVALGLAAFGVYSILCARWIKVIPRSKRRT